MRISQRHATTSGTLITKIRRQEAAFKISPARWIDGNATLTTLLSRIAMLDPRIVATSVSCFVRVRAGGS